jgi:hypothetical protein
MGPVWAHHGPSMGPIGNRVSTTYWIFALFAAMDAQMLLIQLWMLVWVVARSDDSRYGCRMPIESVYTQSVKTDLAAALTAPVGDVIAADSSAEEWTTFLKHNSGRVLGCALLSPRPPISLATILSSQEREVADYWLRSVYAKNPLVFIDIIDFVACVPIVNRIRHSGKTASVFFSEIGISTQDSLLRNGSADGRRFQDIWDEWAQQDNVDVSNTNIALYVPLPHAVLVSISVWRAWAFPYMLGKQRRGHHYNLGIALWNGFVPDQDVLLDDPLVEGETRTFSPVDMLTLADLMRHCLTHVPQGHCVRDEALVYIAKMMRMRNDFMTNAVVKSKRAFQLRELITAVIMSGLLRDGGDLSEICIMSLELTVPEIGLRKFFKDLLQTKGSLPSRSTLYRHRFALHMAWCLHLASEVGSMLDDGAIVSWRTLDLSPKGGVEWVMTGASTMKQSDLVHAFHLSKSLFRDICIMRRQI